MSTRYKLCEFTLPRDMVFGEGALQCIGVKASRRDLDDLMRDIFSQNDIFNCLLNQQTN